MKLEILAKNYDVGQKFEDVAEKKLAKLDKYFGEDASAKVMCKKEKNTFVLELTIYTAPVLRAEARNGEDMYTNIDVAIAKIIRQVHRHKDRMDSKISAFAKEQEMMKFVAPEEETPATVVKKKSFVLEPVSLEDAIVKLDMLDHNFFVYLDSETGRINVLYKRLDGDYGVIETVV